MTFGDSPEPAGRSPRSVPKPKWLARLRVDPRGYPIIAAIGQAPGDIDFAALSESRKLGLATFDLCAVCALPLGEELRWQVAFDEAAATAKPLVSTEAPVHEVCALYAAQVCPLVSSPYAGTATKSVKARSVLMSPSWPSFAGQRGPPGSSAGSKWGANMRAEPP